jgi:hypothetical protein
MAISLAEAEAIRLRAVEFGLAFTKAFFGPAFIGPPEPRPYGPPLPQTPPSWARYALQDRRKTRPLWEYGRRRRRVQ